MVIAKLRMILALFSGAGRVGLDAEKNGRNYTFDSHFSDED